MVANYKNLLSIDMLYSDFLINVQKEVSNKIVSVIGYDNKAGYINVSVHSFTSSMSSKDVRITSRYS